MMNDLFAGLKVVELASVLAGPMVGTFFSELGAHVVKIENKRTGGDVTRQWRLPGEDEQAKVSAYYASANYRKQSLMLDLSNEDDYRQALEFIRHADIVIVNFKPGDAQKLRLDYDYLKTINDKLIYAELNGFGEHNNRTAFDVVLQAESGFMFMNGEKNSAPLKMPVAIIDLMAAHQLKQGILCALIAQSRNVRPLKVSVSLYDSALASLANQATNWLMNHKIPKAIGSQHPNIAPYGDLFECSDGRYIVLAVGNNRQFADLCETLQGPDLASLGLFNTNESRVKNREELNQLLEAAFRENTSGFWQQKLTDKEIPFGLVKNIKEVFEDEAAQALVLQENQEGRPTSRVKTVAFSIAEN
jgi:crotonobetainyl-CoA:carnitine CoA-transferase CaiB-like acyl-CoA transferase